MGDLPLSLAHGEALHEGEPHLVVRALEHRDKVGNS